MRRAITPFSDLVALIRLFLYFRRERFDLIHTHTPKANHLGQLAGWLARVPRRVITVHGFYFHDGMPKWRRHFYIVLEKISSTCAHWIFSQNHEDIATAIREGISQESKLHFLGNGVDVDYFRRDKHLEAAARLRAELRIPPEAPVVGIVGRLTFEKGYREFLEAAAIICRQQPGVHFVAVGPEDVISRSAVETMAKALNPSPALHFCGMQVDMPRFYAMMTAFALPSHREGMPRALIEAAAMSVPAVATDIRGCREIVDPSQTGLLVPVGDAARLAKAIVDLLGNPERARAMGKKARRNAEQEFDERVVFARIRDAYAVLLGCPTMEPPGSNGPPRAPDSA
jgi:glycosyltransferase involved in cell wall biosynthesis